MSIFIILHQALVCMFDLRIVFILRWREYKLGVDFQMKHQWAEIPWWKMIEQCQAPLRRCSVKRAMKKRGHNCAAQWDHDWEPHDVQTQKYFKIMDHHVLPSKIDYEPAPFWQTFTLAFVAVRPVIGNANAGGGTLHMPAHCISKVKTCPLTTSATLFFLSF